MRARLGKDVRELAREWGFRRTPRGVICTALAPAFAKPDEPRSVGPATMNLTFMWMPSRLRAVIRVPAVLSHDLPAREPSTSCGWPPAQPSKAERLPSRYASPI